MNTVRLITTLDKNTFEKLENEKNKKNIRQSALIQQIIQYYFTTEMQEKKIEHYLSGYQKTPEQTGRVVEVEKEQCQVLNKKF